MIAAVVVVLDEGVDLPLEIAGQEVVFEQDAVLNPSYSVRPDGAYHQWRKVPPR